MAREVIPPAIASAQMGMFSAHGFLAFFKSDASSKPVISILEKIRDQKAIRGNLPNIFKASGPEFICVKEDTTARYKRLGVDPQQVCKQLQNHAFWLRKSRYIFLCDSFFDWRISPASIGPGVVRDYRPASSCLQVRDNLFIGFGNMVCLYQKYMLIHEMVHFYLGRKSLTLGTNPPEQYSLEHCIDLSAGLSLRNPQNYQAFVASKLLPLLQNTPPEKCLVLE